MEANITYQSLGYLGKRLVAVYLNGSKVGEIRTVPGGFSYFPKGQKTGGETFPTVTAVKTSLESY